MLARAVGRLDRRSRQVVQHRFGVAGRDPRTLQDVGDELGLSRERVRQIEARALDGPGARAGGDAACARAA